MTLPQTPVTVGGSDFSWKGHAMQPHALRAADTRPRRQRVTPKSTFSELTAKVQAAGLMRRRYGFYWSLMAASIIALAGIGVGMVLLGDSWLQVLMAGAL